jgi:hypothetical protein
MVDRDKRLRHGMAVCLCKGKRHAHRCPMIQVFLVEEDVYAAPSPLDGYLRLLLIYTDLSVALRWIPAVCETCIIDTMAP